MNQLKVIKQVLEVILYLKDQFSFVNLSVIYDMNRNPIPLFIIYQ